ncbi:DMT family transporter [Trichormus variabilis]|jgi:drug/metabolite transporter (DMT)-like permease|uniref:Multidrug DMT transporter permease n=1 Tax=Trichormus variabilis SAG 1403-4b TaxID=447716 RepID=A0A433UKS8_ANAVA|nr:DMT family transporter [Trichormus variabilis]MBD2629033.1 DMT family transporter [Trichormus variabilis FACHB-164]RUS94466.1 multidrug DMT transporter permease [Trichormus variabilis SAG 1403-4b]
MKIKSGNQFVRNHKTNESIDAETLGLAYGFLGVLIFSLTLPSTRLAVAELDSTFVGLGRAVVASILAALLLKVTRQPIPLRRHLSSLVVVALGVIVGFPLLSAWAMRSLPASHGAIIVGILPLATAIVGALRTGERPSTKFWLCSGIGSTVVVGFAVITGGGRLQITDLALLGAVIAAAVGYAEGGRLSRELGGWQVICWALVLSAIPLTVPVAIAIAQHGLHASLQAWLGFGYVSVFSMFLGFFAWYHGLAIGGVVRVSQMQLLQPFLTIFASVLFLQEQMTTPTIITALVVFATVAVGKKAPIYSLQ